MVYKWSPSVKVFASLPKATSEWVGCAERYTIRGLSGQLGNDSDADLGLIHTVIGLVVVDIRPRMGGEHHQTVMHILDHRIDYGLRSALHLS